MMVAHDNASGSAQAALLARAAGGDAQAAKLLTATLAPRAHAQAFRMLGSRAEAEDVVQDAMLRLWRVAPRWDASGGALPSTWLYQVVRNLCLDRMRRARALSLDDAAVPEPMDTTPGAEARMQQTARRQALHNALRALPERQRQAVVLRHLEGYANPEIAKIMEISVEAVESLTSRGKRALASQLAARKDELGLYDEQT